LTRIRADTSHHQFSQSCQEDCQAADRRPARSVLGDPVGVGAGFGVDAGVNCSAALIVADDAHQGVLAHQRAPEVFVARTDLALKG
jgi:hypothetical protein